MVDLLKYLLFTSIYLFISNWFQIISFAQALIRPKDNSKTLNDKWIMNTIRKKTGLKLEKTILFSTPKMFGMMLGIPLKPVMILTKGLYEAFNKDELEWVILHEAGHCVLWHNLQAALIELVLLCISIYLVTWLQLSFTLVVVFAIILSLITIQIMRWGIEYQADRYSIIRVDNPQGVITAQQKFQTARFKNYFYRESSLGRRLLHWNILPSIRIAMANREIIKRKTMLFKAKL